ncbi:MAG: hypothetical protein E7K72_19330 [Roseomonas mucosa]|nr:hypothetical protein [Roseomonas mucosa]
MADYARTFDASLTLSDGRPVFVEYTAEGGSCAVTWGPPEHCDPGEPPEITITRAWLGADGEGGECVLSNEEDERLCEHLATAHEEPSDDYLD